MILNLSLENKLLYHNIPTKKVGGRLTMELTDDTLNRVGENIEALIRDIHDRMEITLTGAAPIPVYLVAFHCVVHRFRNVYYENEMYRLLVASH